LDHIANFLNFISSPQSFWFSDTSYKHGCHLASRFRLDPEEYTRISLLPAWYRMQDLASISRPMLGESSLVAVGLYSTIVQLNSNRKRLNSMPTSTGHRRPDLNKRDSTLLELGIKVSNRPTKLRNRMVGMGD
jgi:hypothetical protein